MQLSAAGQVRSSRRDPAAGDNPDNVKSAAVSQQDDGLKIAWQYRKYIQQQQRSDNIPATSLSTNRPSSLSSAPGKPGSTAKSSAQKALAAGISREWCHQYDLSRGLTPGQLQGSKFETYCCQAEQGCAVQAAAQAAASFVQRFQQAQCRGVIPQLQAGWLFSHWEALPGGPAGVVAATVAAAAAAGMFSTSFASRLQHLADAVFSLQCLADNSDVYKLLPDAASASALLEVRRLPHLGLLRQKFIEDKLYLIRHKRKGISVSLLDLLPLEAVDDKAADQQRPSEVPVVAKVCGSGHAGWGEKNVMEF
eukprot:gene12661-12788_t